MFRMIVKTQTVGKDGRPRTTTERIPHIPASQVESRRQAARQSAPRGATRTIRVVDEV